MPTLHVTNRYNVKSSINAWLRDSLNAYSGSLPVWLTMPAIIFNVPENTAPLPAISVIHLPGGMYKEHEGRAESATTKAMTAYGIADISGWVSRDSRYNGEDVWEARLNFIESMTNQVIIGTPTLVISDYNSNPDNPAATSYRIVLGDLSTVQTAPDVNPAIRRVRMLLNYSWTVRV